MPKDNRQMKLSLVLFLTIAKDTALIYDTPL